MRITEAIQEWNKLTGEWCKEPRENVMGWSVSKQCEAREAQRQAIEDEIKGNYFWTSWINKWVFRGISRSTRVEEYYAGSPMCRQRQ